MTDPIQDFFDRVRSNSKNAPKLDKPAPKMKISHDAPVKKYRVGRPTGPDGRRQRRSLDIPSLGATLNKEIVRRGWENELADGWVIGNWTNLVGERIAAHTKPERIKDKVVYISCDASVWATELRYLQRQILRKIADRLGPDVIVELRIQGPKQHRNYQGRQWVKPQGSQDTYG
ncbi:DciA family protein [Corynebacterium simulans]|uniref:DciA family protein n=1 Tax=Corynebacterium simulans TaxID=146827 RepID=UPI00254E158F|nr:DciA family protein [Corynebacterium simulans]MDK7138916.1 DciA family protein [Corynebacterium simulans]